MSLKKPCMMGCIIDKNWIPFFILFIKRQNYPHKSIKTQTHSPFNIIYIPISLIYIHKSNIKHQRNVIEFHFISIQPNQWHTPIPFSDSNSIVRFHSFQWEPNTPLLLYPLNVYYIHFLLFNRFFKYPYKIFILFIFSM